MLVRHESPVSTDLAIDSPGQYHPLSPTERCYRPMQAKSLHPPPFPDRRAYTRCHSRGSALSQFLIAAHPSDFRFLPTQPRINDVFASQTLQSQSASRKSSSWHSALELAAVSATPAPPLSYPCSGPFHSAFHTHTSSIVK